MDTLVIILRELQLLPVSDSLPILKRLKDWLDKHMTEFGIDSVNNTFKSEGLGGSGSHYMLRYLKNPDTCELGTEIITSLTPIDVLCGSKVSRSFSFEFLGKNLEIVTGDQEQVGLGFKVWPAAREALEILSNNSDVKLKVQGRTVVELGAGLGLVSLAAAVSGAHQVIASDFNKDLLEICSQNFERNNHLIVPGTLSRTRFLDWQQVGVSDFLDDIPTGSLLIGTDTVYYPEHSDMLSNALIYFFEKRISNEALLVLSKNPFRPGIQSFIEIATQVSLWTMNLINLDGLIVIQLKTNLNI